MSERRRPDPGDDYPCLPPEDSDRREAEVLDFPPDQDRRAPAPEDHPARRWSDDPVLEDFRAHYEIVLRPRADAADAHAPGGSRTQAELFPPAPPPPAQILPPPPPPVALAPPAVPHEDPIPGIIAHGSICTISGASGVGKTALLAGWVRAFQEQSPIGGHPVGRIPQVGIITCDRPWRDHQSWFDKAGCAPLAHYSLHDDDTFNWDLLRDWRQVPTIFAQCVDRVNLPPGSILICDPVPLFIPGRLIDYKDAAIGMAHIGRIIRARQLTLLGVFHVAKEKGNKANNYLRPQDRILGSGGQIGYSETAIYLMAPDESGADYYQVGWVPHQRPAESFRLERDHQGLFQEVDTLTATEKELREIDQVEQLIAPGTDHMSSSLVPLIMNALRCQERKAKALISKACHHRRIEKVGRGAYRRISA